MLITRLVLLLLLFPVPALAQKLPLWEVGIGAGGLYLPDYRGADEYSAFLIPFPYLVYRGKRLNIDEGGVHGHLFKSDRTRLDISLAGGVPVAEKAEGLRSGMPALAPTAELGPSLEHILWRTASEKRTLWLRMPLRAVLSAGLENGLRHQGWSFSPYLEYIHDSPAEGKWRIGVAVGPQYGDLAYHDYFYSVDQAYQTPQRPAWQAPAGYGGSRVTLTMQYNINDLWLGGMLRYDTLRGSAFSDSPLVASQDYLALGIAFTWVFAKSDMPSEY